MKKRPAGTAHVSNSVFALPGCCCCCFLGMPPSTSFFWMIWRITKFFRPNGVWLGFHHGILNLIPNFGQPHVSVVKVISVLAPPSLLKSSAINFDGFSYWGCGEKEALQQSDRGIFAFLQFSLSVHVKWTSIRLENWHSAFCNLIYVIFLQDDGQPPGAQPLQPKASLFFSWLCSNIKNSCLKMAARKNVVMSSQENLLWCCDHKKMIGWQDSGSRRFGMAPPVLPKASFIFFVFLFKHLQHDMWSLK